MDFGRRVGKQVAFIPTTPENTRNGEGDFIRLKNGDIMYAYTEYRGQTNHDDDAAYITAIFSSDEGESFGNKRQLFDFDKGDVNHMSVSLVRLNNGELGLIYIVKYMREDGEVGAASFFRSSSDEGLTWSKRVNIAPDYNYLCVCNGRALRLKSGRILVPTYYAHTINGRVTEYCTAHFFYSDDDGKTWKESKEHIENPVDKDYCGLQETGIHQLENGKIISYSRTAVGVQFVSFSEDDGDTWTSSISGWPNLISAIAPMTVKTLKNNQTIIILNPIPEWLGKAQYVGANKSSFNRTPFICLVQNGDGTDLLDPNAVWGYFIEDDKRYVYCYPSIFVGDDYFLVGYYHSNGGPTLSCGKIKKVMYSEIDHPDTDLRG